MLLSFTCCTRLLSLLPGQQVIKLAPKSNWRQMSSRSHRSNILFDRSRRKKVALGLYQEVLLSLKLEMAPNSPYKRHITDDCIKDGNSERIVLKFCKCREGAQAPKRGSDKAAGFDLYSAVEIVIPAKGKGKVETGLQIALPENCYGRIAPRSGLASKNFIDVGAGVIDQDYRGEVGVLLFNFSDENFKVTQGMRIAQLICEKIYMPKLTECEKLDETTRGSGGYGSSGLH
ncbi:deoxyuridine 5'-triphosphate nucleotidohydrolase-like [Anneissia japonica]|uniref:deoxyuridine 5'-triphosphate nucleotidohydrolase-like n=1 Tax=Anneissia japonica TaxID=1529436 RepID=UPI001425679D|nr:deoxyuridine 5'-triphosphate nucleotidohydrolase-like [Anneissia japonica]